MDCSQTASDKKDSLSEKSKTNLPIVICLDSQSENSVNQPKQVINLAKFSTQNENKTGEVIKRKRVRKIKKNRKVIRQVQQIIDDDTQIGKGKRISIRLSKKGLKHYRQTQSRRIKRAKPNSQKQNNINQTSNTIDQKQTSKIIDKTQNTNTIQRNQNLNTTDRNQTSLMIENSSSPLQILLQSKIHLQPTIPLPQNHCSTSQQMISQANQIEKVKINQNQNQKIPSEKQLLSDKKNSRNQLVQSEKQCQLQNRSIHSDSIQLDNNNNNSSRVMLGDQEYKAVQNKQKDQHGWIQPSHKFFKRFLQKEIVTDRRDAIYNSFIKNSCLKPLKYIKEIQETCSKFINHKSNQIQDDSMNVKKQKIVDNNQNTKQSILQKQSKQVPIIMIEESEQDNDQHIQGSTLQPIQSRPQIQPILQASSMQIEPNNGPNQKLTNHQTYSHQQRTGHDQNRQKPIFDKKNSQNTINQNNYFNGSPIATQNLTIQQDLSISPVQQFIKAKLKRKITKNTVFYSNVQEITQNWEKNPDLSFEQEYPFYPHQNINSKCHLLGSKLRSIVKIKKYERPDVHPTTCFVFYQNKYPKDSINLPTIIDSQLTQTPHEVELDQVRLIYPEKLLEFYEMALKANLKNLTSIDKAETQYELPEKAQDRIKYHERVSGFQSKQNSLKKYKNPMSFWGQKK